MRKLISLLMALIMLLSMATVVSAGEVGDLPRNETMYFAGMAWSPPTHFNPLNPNNRTWPANDQREVLFETLYMYNMITNVGEPLLADGEPTWEDDHNLVVKVKDAAKWNDGTPLTNEDVAYTYNLANKYALDYTLEWDYLEKVEAIDNNSVRFTLKAEPYNRLSIIGSFCTVNIVPKHVWEPREEEAGGDVAKLMEYTDLDTLVNSGAYKPYYSDDTRIVVVRDDNYWGQDASMFGKLPAPKYLCHPIFADNAAGNLALQENQIDVSQQFMTGVADLKATNPDISTYLPDNPYYLAGSMPSLVFNVTVPGLDDPIMRRAIALSIDYEAIGADAMDGMTEDIVPSIFLMINEAQSSLLNDSDKIDELRWDTADVDANREAAAALLDEAGYVDADGDGFRDMPDGTAIAWKLECPFGWSDWNASLEIVQRSAQEIGLNLETYFPEQPIYDQDRFYGTFDIIMQSPHGMMTPAFPWRAIRNVMYTNAGVDELATTNAGRYSNARIDELLDLVGGESDTTKINEYYTEIEEIFLTDLPTVPLMYRPWLFHTINESVWTGFPQLDDGSGIPPQVATDGAAVRTLYNVTVKE